METQRIWEYFNEELYFFILKKVKNKQASNDVFQNTFLKIHKNKHQIQDEDKLKAWVFQIARNEIFNYFNQEAKYVADTDENLDIPIATYENICCFDRFITDLPENYRQVVELVYIHGKKQKDVAEDLNLSLHNVKARVRRAKDMLKVKFNTCCKFEFDKNGNLIGQPNCSICDKV